MFPFSSIVEIVLFHFKDKNDTKYYLSYFNIIKAIDKDYQRFIFN